VRRGHHYKHTCAATKIVSAARCVALRHDVCKKPPILASAFQKNPTTEGRNGSGIGSGNGSGNGTHESAGIGFNRDRHGTAAGGATHRAGGNGDNDGRFASAACDGVGAVGRQLSGAASP
jgi:hypothetical protein